MEPQGRARVVQVAPEKGRRRLSHKVRDLLVTNVHPSSELHTDESLLYTQVGKQFAAHKTFTHASNQGDGFYVGEDGQTTNAVENFFGNFKRSMNGTYRFCGEQHLQRYLNEFEFRHNHRAELSVRILSDLPLAGFWLGA